MIIKKLYLLFIFLFIFNNYTLISDDFEQYLFELNVDEPDNNLLFIFEYYRDFPIDIYNTNEYTLSRLPDISFALAKELINDFKLNKEWKDIKSINNLSYFQIKILESCTNIINKNKNFDVNYRSRLINNIEDKSGFVDGKFKGDKLDLYNRLSIDYNNFKFNVIANKDEGESSMADDYSANMNYNYKNHNITIGDFRANSGLGLMLNTGYPVRKSSNPSDAFMNLGSGITPSRNLQALGYLRGIAYQTEYLLSNFRIKSNIFYSNFNRPATLIDDNNISSFYLNNLFRTDTEIRKKNAINEQLIGSNIEVNYDKFILGFNYLNYNYDKNINSESQNYYNSKYGDNFSTYFNYSSSNHIFSSEVAFDKNRNPSLYSIYTFKNNNQEYGISYRYLNANSRLQYNNVLTNYSTNSNETGVFTFFTFRENNIKNTIYFDIFERPKIDYFQGIPQSGIEIFDEFTYKFSDEYSILSRLRFKSQKEIIKSGTPRYFDRDRIDFRQELRIQKSYSLRFRFDINTVNFSENRYSGLGYLFFTEFSKTFFKSFNNSIRLTYYNTDSFEEAIWHYEYLLRGYLLAPPLYGEGFKLLFRSSYRLFDDYLLSLAYSFDNIANVNSLGSGLVETQGNQRNRIFFQFEYNLGQE